LLLFECHNYFGIQLFYRVDVFLVIAHLVVTSGMFFRQLW